MAARTVIPFPFRAAIPKKGKQMADDNTNPPVTNPPPATTPPADPPTPPSPQPPPATNNSGSILAAVNALPEKLVDAVRELIPQQAPQQQQQQQQTPPAQQQQQQTPPASAGTNQPDTRKRRTFGEVWFGINR